MLKGLVTVAIFGLGISVACSQNGGTTATVDPDPPTPATAKTATTNNPSPPAPAPTDTALADALERSVAPAQARQVPSRGRGFVPLDDPIFLAADDTEFFGDDELVLGVEFAGEVRAYPVRMLRYHHIVNDTVGGEPLLVTY